MMEKKKINVKLSEHFNIPQVDQIVLFQRKSDYFAIVGDKYHQITAFFYAVIAAIQKHGSLEKAFDNGSSIQKYIDPKKLNDFLPLIENKIQTLFAKKSKSYIYYTFSVFPIFCIQFLAYFLNFLFDKKIFSIVFLCSIALNIYFFKLNSISYSELSFSYIFYFFGLFFILLFHELGHAIAGLKYGKQVYPIQFGWYNRFLPVLFANVSFVWLLSTSEKIIVNLGGIYFQLLIHCGLMAYFYFFPSSTILQLYKTSLFLIFYALIPYFRSDGYWVFSDVLQIKNLHEKSMNYWVLLLKGKQKIRSFLTIYNFFKLIFYSFLSYKIEKMLYFMFVKIQLCYFENFQFFRFLNDIWMIIFGLLFFIVQLGSFVKFFKIFVFSKNKI